MEKKKSNFDKFNKKIEIKYETQIKALVIAYMCFYVLNYLYDFLERIPTIWMTRFAEVGLKLVTTLPVLVCAHIWGIYKKNEPKHDFKNYKQYVVGILLLIPYIGMAWLLSGGKLFSDRIVMLHREPSDMIWFFVYYALVGVQEEWVFRRYIQGELSIIFGRCRVLAPFVSAVLFAVAHIPQGYPHTVLVAFCVGLILGYAKYFFKDCTFISVVMAHWLYDFLLAVL